MIRPIATHELIPVSTIRPGDKIENLFRLQITQEQHDILLALGDVIRNPKGYGTLGIRINAETYILKEIENDKNNAKHSDQGVQGEATREVSEDS